MAKVLPAALKATGIEKNPGAGKRTTFSAAEIATIKRFGGDGAVDSDGGTTIESLQASIDAVNDNPNLDRAARTRALDVLVPMKNHLIREEMGVA